MKKKRLNLLKRLRPADKTSGVRIVVSDITHTLGGGPRCYSRKGVTD